MFVKEKEVWRDGVFLCHTRSSLDADILESKLRSGVFRVLRNIREPAIS